MKIEVQNLYTSIRQIVLHYIVFEENSKLVGVTY